MIDNERFMELLHNPDPKALRRAMDAENGVTHLDGIDWTEAPIPPRFHRCWPQTSGMGVQRCACGAIGRGFGPWMEKNSRRGPWWKSGRGERRD